MKNIIYTIFVLLAIGLNSGFSQSSSEKEYFKEDYQKFSGNKRIAAEQNFEEGKKEFDNSEFRGALAYLNEAIKLQPDHVMAYFLRAGARENLKDLKGALTDLDIVIHLDPTLTEAFFSRAMVKYNLENYAGAIEDFSRLLAMPAPNTQAVYFKGTSYGSTRPGVTQMISMYSKDADIHNYIGLAKTKIKDLEGAIEEFNTAIAKNPSDPNYYVNRGMAWAKLNNPEEAGNDYRKALQIEPDHALALFNLSLNSSGSQDDLETYNRIIKDNEDFPSAYVNRGLISYKAGNYEEALVDFSYAIKLDPENSLAFFNRALSRDKLNLPKEALKDLNQAIKLDPEMNKAYSSRGNIYFKLQEYEDALEDYNIAVSRAAADPSVYYNRALAKYKLNQIPEACLDLETALEQGYEAAQKALEAYCNP